MSFTHVNKNISGEYCVIYLQGCVTAEPDKPSHGGFGWDELCINSCKRLLL